MGNNCDCMRILYESNDKEKNIFIGTHDAERDRRSARNEALRDSKISNSNYNSLDNRGKQLEEVNVIQKQPIDNEITKKNKNKQIPDDSIVNNIVEDVNNNPNQNSIIINATIDNGKGKDEEEDAVVQQEQDQQLQEQEQQEDNANNNANNQENNQENSSIIKRGGTATSITIMKEGRKRPESYTINHGSKNKDKFKKKGIAPMLGGLVKASMEKNADKNENEEKVE